MRVFLTRAASAGGPQVLQFVSLMLAGMASALAGSGTPAEPSDAFNSYIVQAVNLVAAHYTAEGYGQSAYTHKLKYGPYEIPAGPKAPQTMCVAAVAEVIITALNLYMEESRDYGPATYLTADGWSRLRPADIKAHIWVDRHLQSYGTADALSTFGVGHHLPFTQLTPGSFVNLNRTNGGGHAVVFMAYIDNQGRELPAYSDEVAGLKYFSSQGRSGAPGSGFGFKYGFFNVAGKPYCPKLGGGKRVDCGIIYSFSQHLLNSGYMLVPRAWDKAYRDQSLAKLAEHLYQQNYSKGPAEERLPGVRAGMSRDEFISVLQQKDTMTLNPQYSSENMPDDKPK
jgi:hypothetical protein